jgi:hypothetical protein
MFGILSIILEERMNQDLALAQVVEHIGKEQ